MKKWLKILTSILITGSIFINNIPIVYSENSNDLYNRTVSKVTFDKTIGINAFIDDPLSVMEVAGTVREYHNYSWTLDKANEHKFSPSYVKWWSFDDYYKKLYESGITVMPCIQGTSSAVVNNLPSNQRGNKPINDDENSLDPASYSEHAATMYQYAARYGKVKVDDSKLLLAADQTRVSGLGYIEYYENWNEPDKTWEGAKANFSAEELAAMSSADYDGHEGRLGNTYGIKNADPNAKLVLGGVAGNGNYVNYLNGIREWSLNNRTDKQLPFDVLNFHMYVGKSTPEASNFRERLDEITSWRDTYAAEKEVWLTEFGWDTNIKSPNGVSPENQRNFLMRSYLIANAHGIDRSTMYMIRDTGGDGKYGTSGLTGPKDDWTKKTSWYGVYTLKNTLKGFTFNKIIKENDDIYIYKFINNNTNEECYVLWTPTDNNSKINNYKLNIGNMQKATITTFIDNEINGKTENLSITNNEVSINVNETPTFVKISEPKEDYTPLSFKTSLSLNKNNVYINDNIELSININELTLNNSIGIKGINGTLQYDSNLFDITSIKTYNDFNITKKEVNNNQIIINTMNDNYLTQPENIIKINLKVKENITNNSKITFKSIIAQSEKDNISSEDVSINIKVNKKDSNSNSNSINGNDDKNNNTDKNNKNDNDKNNNSNNINEYEKIPNTGIMYIKNNLFDLIYGFILITSFIYILAKLEYSKYNNK